MPEISSYGSTARHIAIAILLGLAGNACQAPGIDPAAVQAQVKPAESQRLYHPPVALEELFGEIQMAQIFDDGKTLVDSRPQAPPQQILQEYRYRKTRPGFDLAAFTEQYLQPPRTLDTTYRTGSDVTMEVHIGQLWNHLSRQPDLAAKWSSLIPLPNPYVVPGGRFREIYYWDTYFTMHGLVANGRLDMVRSMLDNFSWLIDTVGHIPNGNRSYYMSRSQPPFFSAMVALYAGEAGLHQAERYLPYLKKEYGFWMDGEQQAAPSAPVRRVVRMPDNTLLNRYYDDLDVPRPESFREDVLVAQNVAPASQADTYRHLRAAAESGWDFSSRWLDQDQGLSSIHTTDFIPIDLNSLLYHLELTLSKLSSAAGNDGQEKYYADRALNRRKAIQRWLWDTERRIYTDYNWRSRSLSPTASLAMVYPLYFEVAERGQAEQVAGFLRHNLLMPGGLVTTLNATGEQWDYPNGWAPLQWLSIQGLRRYGNDALADTIADRWLTLNRRVFENTGRMMEKYNVVDIDLPAGGGEYPLQDGFGWTNGVAEALLQAQ